MAERKGESDSEKEWVGWVKSREKNGKDKDVGG